MPYRKVVVKNKRCRFICIPIFLSSTCGCLHLLFCCAAANGITSTVESLQFNFATIEAATNNFSNDNKLGEGGFGAVYKVNY
jgi:hypothetical protein